MVSNRITSYNVCYTKLLRARIIDFSEDHLYRLKDEYQVLMRKGDTLNGISVLARIGYVYSHHANYSKSYNYLWEALLLADQINDHVSIAYLNEQIGWLYSYFNRKDVLTSYSIHYTKLYEKPSFRQ